MKAPPATLEALSGMIRRLRPRTSPELTAKNRARLRQFDDGAAIAALLRLPERLARCAGHEAGAKRAARQMEMAVAIGILIHCPMRIQNLRQLDLRRHFVGRQGGPRRIVIPADEVKNRRELDYQLTSDLAALIERFARDHLSIGVEF